MQNSLRHIFRGTNPLALLVLGLCEFVRGALLFFILPIYAHGVLGFSEAVVGYAMAAHYTLDTGLRTPAGWLVDRFGQRNVLVSTLALAWLGLWFIVKAHHALLLVFGCALLGVGMASVWPATISRVTQGLPIGAYATAMGGVMMAWLIGAGGGAVCMSWFFGNHVGRGFIVLLLLWLCAYGLAMVAMQGFRSNHRERKRVHILYILREVKDVRVLFPGMFVQTFAWGLLLPVLALYAHYILGFDGRMYSYLLLAAGGAVVLLQVPFGRLVDKFGYRRFLALGFVLSALMLALILHLHVTWHIYLGVVGFGAAYALILPSWNSVLARSVSERQRAAMFGVFMTVEGLGMAVGPLVGMMLWNRFGPYAPFYGAACILLGMSVLYSTIRLDKLFLQAKIESRNAS